MACGLRQQRSDLRHRISQSLGILRGDQSGKFQDAGKPNQQLAVLHQLRFLKNRRKKFLLDIDHEKRAALGFKRGARDFA